MFNNSNSKLEQKKAKQKVHSKRTFNCSWPGCNRSIKIYNVNRCSVNNLECILGFFQKFSLQKHSEFHISNKNIVCEFCFARFGTSIYMRAHLKKKHNIIVPARTVFAKFYNEPDVTTRPNKKLTKLLLCPHCDNKKFSFLASFNQHMKIHNTHHCKLCSASFSNQKYLNFHLYNTHFAAINCPIISCGYSSFNRFRYKAHLTKMHSQDDLYGSLIAEADRLRPNYKELKFCLETA